MARILIADTPDGVATLERLLVPEHQLTIARTMLEVVPILEQQQFDLIVIGVHFDESRMFELMSYCKNNSNSAKKPIICFCSRSSPLTRTMHDSLVVTSKALGAWMYLDQYDYDAKKNRDAKLRRLFERCLLGSARKKTQNKRLGIQKHREVLLRLRQELEDEEWSVDLEDQVAELREKLSKVLLDLSVVQTKGIAEQEQVAESKVEEDQVSSSVVLGENGLSREEIQIALVESEQLGKEQEIIPQEEDKAKKGRRELTTGTHK